jgi:hypothetical protein
MATEPIIINKGNYKVIDPNPLQHTIDHEDLFTYVSLVAKTKGRTYLTEKDDGSIEFKPLKLSGGDMIASRERTYLGTDWTNIGGSQLDAASIQGDLEGFGITNIDIEIKSSFIPKVVIDFVDIRGATLFEQGSCSPYSVFFHLPYPVFHLTVKGYYGKPVRYYLNLVKFNTKFNSETGNFESKAEFVGWSYAFLADMLMGFVMAAGKMYDWNSDCVLEQKYEETMKYYRENGLYDPNTFADSRVASRPDNPFCKPAPAGKCAECITILDMLKKIENIEDFLEKVKGTVEYEELGKLIEVRSDIQKMISDVKVMSREMIEAGADRPVLTKAPNRQIKERFVFKEAPNQGVKQKFDDYLKRRGTNDNTDGYLLDDVEIIKPKVVRSKNTKYCAGEISEYFLATSSGNKCGKDVDKANIFDILNNQNWQKGFSEFNWKDGSVSSEESSNGIQYFLDLGFLLQHLEDDIEALNLRIDERRDEVKDAINKGVTNQLGFLPTIRNVFTVLNVNTEAFMELLLECNVLAEQHHDGRRLDYLKYAGGDPKRIHDATDKTEDDMKVYPWPTYYEKDYRDITEDSSKNKTQSKEVYPGERTEFQTWEEVRFVEDFLRALLDLKRDFENLKDDKTGIPGFDNYIAISPLENKIYDKDIGIKYKDLDENRGGVLNDDEKILATIAERMFITTHHHIFDPVHVNRLNVGLGFQPPHKTTSTIQTQYKEFKFPAYNADNGIDLIEALAEADADNLLNTIQKERVLLRAKSALESTTILNDTIEALKTLGTIKEVNISEANPEWNELLSKDRTVIKDILNKPIGSKSIKYGETYVTYEPNLKVGDSSYINIINEGNPTYSAQGGIFVKPNHYDMDSDFIFQLLAPDNTRVTNTAQVTFKSDNEERSSKALEKLQSTTSNIIGGGGPTFISGFDGSTINWAIEDRTKSIFFEGNKLFSSIGINAPINNLDDDEDIDLRSTSSFSSNMGVIGYLTQYKSVDAQDYAGKYVFLAFNQETQYDADILYPCIGNYFMFRTDSDPYDAGTSRAYIASPSMDYANEGILAKATVSGNRDGSDGVGYDTEVSFKADGTSANESNKEHWRALQLFDHLVQTPLWSDNVNRFREHRGSNYKLETPPDNSTKETYNTRDIEYRNLAYLFLAGCKPSPLITMGRSSEYEKDTGVLYDSKNFFIADNPKNTYPKTLYPFSKIGGIVKAPRVWVLGLGATLWRWRTFMGINKNGKGDILWRHPNFGEKPIGLDPLAQPGHPATSDQGDRLDRSDTTGPNNVVFYNFNTQANGGKRINSQPTGPDPSTLTNPPLQKSVFKQSAQNGDYYVNTEGKGGQWGYSFDYWGVYNNVIKNTNLGGIRRPQKRNWGSPVWDKLRETYQNTSSGINLLIDDIDLTKTATDKQFKTMDNAISNTRWPLLWIAPWQHFYTEPVSIEGSGSPLKAGDDGPGDYYTNEVPEKILTFIAKDRPWRDYQGSFIGYDWDKSTDNLYGEFNERWGSVTINSKYLKTDEKSLTWVYNYSGSENFTHTSDGQYGNLIALLPDYVKDAFVKEFEDWVVNEWAPNPTEKGFTTGWLGVVDPVNYLEANRTGGYLGESYTVGSFDGYNNGAQGQPGSAIIGEFSAERLEKHFYAPVVTILGTYHAGNYDFYAWTQLNKDKPKVKELEDHLYNENYTIVNTTPKLWNVVYQDYDAFTVNKGIFDIYINAFKKYFNDNFGEKKEELDDNKADEEGIFGGTVLDDADTKLSLYRSFKSLSDKWISSSSRKGNGESRMFFNVVDNEYTLKDRGDGKTDTFENRTPLAGHFSYVNRVMGEIGNKAVLDVTKLERIYDNPKMSLYQTITELLSENKFDFFPLPSFTNFSSAKDEELKDMFRPIDTLQGVNSGPNFICMFVGGTSRMLDLKPKANCKQDTDDLTTENDSFSLIEEGGDVPSEYNPDDLFEPRSPKRIEDGGFTAFKVAYGLENQNHFKNITLDQTEFTETNESLLLIDKLAKGGDPANRELKGNNLHNVYLTRSYKCGVDSLGNMSIQPLQYFELTNVPMFHGTYIITEVKHNIKPHHVGTSFTGVRQPIATVPVVTDVAIAMNMTIKDLDADGSGTLLDDIINQGGVYDGGTVPNSGGGGNVTTTNVTTIGDLSKGCKGSGNPMSYFIKNKAGGVNGSPQDGKNINMVTVPNPLGVVKHNNVTEPQFLEEGVEPMKQMLNDLHNYLLGLGYQDGKTVRLTSLFRSIAKQHYLCCGSSNCYKSGSGKCPQTGSPYGNKRDGSVAIPGTSKHGEGIAMDIGFYKKDGTKYKSGTANNSIGFTSDAYSWLFDRSYLYGFIPRDTLRDGRTDEFWHWEYVGKAAFSYMAAFPEGDNKWFTRTWKPIVGEPQYYSFVKNPIDFSTGKEADLTCIDTQVDLSGGDVQGEEGGSGYDPNNPDYGKISSTKATKTATSNNDSYARIGLIT